MGITPQTRCIWPCIMNPKKRMLNLELTQKGCTVGWPGLSWQAAITLLLQHKPNKISLHNLSKRNQKAVQVSLVESKRESFLSITKLIVKLVMIIICTDISCYGTNCTDTTCREITRAKYESPFPRSWLSMPQEKEDNKIKYK